ncbi:alpha/beta hydrolase [Kibdelosporangium phytohabitans]|uniref:Alpha/beta hydrolase n=1 Tax=Kibdelosporangium phytohabitans TaxID=860235 RepID=A0A0N9IGL1_9PSEU|nr:alpha/beta hydrolase [Kibdelosporangium phytohabitans]ALG15668.1 alpha/beta hydrolase [Kibdelosporangium phytohabitans]
MHQVTGGTGVRLAVRTAGPPGAPAVVLLHGWAQSGAAFSAQLADPRLTSKYRLAAPDLRGHGYSDVPDPGSGYSDPEAWASDVAAVLDLVGTPAILVGWSYGGAVITDYLRAFGDQDLAGIVFASAAVEVGRGRPGAGPGTAMRSVVPYVNLEDLDAATRGFTEFVRGMAEGHLPGELSQRIVGDALRVPWQVRRAMFRRDFDSSGVLQQITVPTLVAHGELDAVVDPSVAHYTVGKIPGARLRWFPKTGHMPFAERTEEFDEMLLEFADQVME